MNAISRFNQKIAIKITNAVSTMWCAYIFAIIALISLPAAIKTGDSLVIVAWVAQTFLQLVLLSIIMVGHVVFREARKYLLNKRDDGPYSFRWICDELGFDHWKYKGQVKLDIPMSEFGTYKNMPEVELLGTYVKE